MKFLHMLYAKMFGYFWLPCPKCGEMFGGHQVPLVSATVEVLEGDGWHSYCVCPKCNTPEAIAEKWARMQIAMANPTSWQSLQPSPGSKTSS